MNSVDSNIILNEVYAEKLFTKQDPIIENCLSGVLFREEEEVSSSDYLSMFIEEYHKNGIYKFFKIDLEQFLSLDESGIRTLIKSALKLNELQDKTDKEILEQLKDDGFEE